MLSQEYITLYALYQMSVLPIFTVDCQHSICCVEFPGI